MTSPDNSNKRRGADDGGMAMSTDREPKGRPAVWTEERRARDEPPASRRARPCPGLRSDGARDE
jgi:hypothetical protein